MVRKLSLVGLFVVIFLLGLTGCNPAGQAIEPVVSPDEVATQTPEPASSPTPDALFTAELDWRVVANHFLPNAPLIVNFNRPVNTANSPLPLRFEPTVEGDFAWDETATNLTFTAKQGFQPGGLYAISPDPALSSADGLLLGDLPTWHILVATRPVIIERTPADIALATDRRPQFTVTFDRPMNPASVAAALQISPATELELAWQENSLTIQPLNPLDPGLNYSFALADTATDMEGIALAAPYHWSYRLTKLVERATWPSLTRPEPVIAIYFNYPIDPTSANLTLNPATTGQSNWNADYTVLTYTLTEPLFSGSQYTISLADGLRDSQGQPLTSPYLGSFRTANIISRVAPVANAQAHPFSPVQITFNQAMDQPSTEAAFSIVPHVPGRLEWHGNMLELHPELGYLLPDTNYQVTLANTALNAHGQAILGQPFSWSFTTIIYESAVTFGEGEQTQVLDANGPRLVQFAFDYDQVAVPTHFELFPLELDHWLEGDLHGHEAIATWDEAPTPPQENEYSHIQQTAIPAGVPNGLYLLQLSVANQPQSHLVLFISRYTLVAKQDADKVLVWLTGLDGSLPAGIEISLYTAQGQWVNSQLTDENGFATFGLPGESQDWKIVARPGNDLTVVVLNRAWEESYGNVWQPNYLAHITTDRHVYHPGQRLYFRAMVSWDNDQMLAAIPAGTPLTIKLWQGYDQWNGQLLASRELSSNRFGTASGSFDLPDSLTAGSYWLQLVVGEQSFRQSFNVWGNRSNDVQLFVSTNADRYASGQEMEVTVLVLDGNGQPISGHYVTISQQESIRSDCYYYDGYSDWETWFVVEDSQIGGRTDSSGRFTTTIPVQYRCGGYENIEGQRVVRAIQAIVSQDGQQYGSFALVELVRQAETIALAFDNQLQIAGVPVAIVADILDLSQQGVGDRQISLTLARYEAHLEGFNGLDTTTLTSDGSGRISHNLTIDRPGYYQVTLSGRDAFGSNYTTQKTFYVYSPNYNGFYGPLTSLSIEPNQDSYTVGEIGQLIIRSNFDGPALLTFSRGLLHRQQLVNLTAPLTLVEVPLLTGDAPNLRVTVHAWQPQDNTDYWWSSLSDVVLKMATTTLNVSDPTTALNITVSGLVGDVPAGSQTNLTIRVTDSAGNPVQAELSLSLVNELLFNDSANQPLPLACSFYAPRLANLPTYHSFAPTRYLDAWGGCGCGGGGWWGEETTLLGNFDDNGLWLPNLYTDSNGEVTISLNLPVTAGSWRLSLQAITANTQIGQSSFLLTTH